MDVDVTGLSETWLEHDDDVISHIPGYSQVNKCRHQKIGGGVSLLLRDHLNCIELSQFSQVTDLFESVFIELETNSKLHLQPPPPPPIQI